MACVDGDKSEGPGVPTLSYCIHSLQVPLRVDICNTEDANTEAIVAIDAG